MTAWYEFEELVGRYWHGWAAQATSYPAHDDARVAFEPLRDTLAVYFRALGGPGAVALTTAQAAGQAHRLSWRQRLGFEREPMELARMDGENLILARSHAVFPEQADNRSLFFWQAAFLARARPLTEVSDPLQADLCHLAEAVRTTREILEEMPGWRSRYARLACRLGALRPVRRLPPVEMGLQQVIRSLLQAEDELDERARAMRQAVTDEPRRIGEFSAPNGYRPPLPVPLWPLVTHIEAARTERRDDEGEEEERGGDSEDLGEQKFSARRRRLEQTERDDPLLLNPFEKVMSWAEMVNVNRPVDDDDKDEARKAATELEELTLAKHRKQAATRLKMGLEIAPEAVAEGRLLDELTLPEWHYAKRKLMPDYCAVQVLEPQAAAEDWRPDAEMRTRIRRVRRHFEALRPRREMLRAQLDGDEFDMDALVRRQTELASGHSGNDRIYTAWRDQSRDLAVSTLVDISLSTESWMDDRRVIDIEKEALLVLAHGIDACGDDQAIHTFTSHRRRRVEITPLKAFDEGLDRRVERRIAALGPGRYTRMGAAMRYVTEGLAARANRHRMLLVLTDGKPNDTDHYEGRYALEDTRMAVREARRQGIVVFGVTIDTQARQYFPLVFGRSGYAIVPRAAALSRALPAIYRKLVQR
ncbi:MAG: VWA domain-containing protein [Gammaproteobacteria bacterium]|nr:VWA domain-containing protein [Gammaproteobacteria bacterium]